MLTIIKPYIMSFIPIFVAVDAIGNIPVFISLVEGANRKMRRKVVLDSVITATVVAILFMFIGKFVFRLLGITIADFQIAGGTLLFIISVRLLMPGAHKNILSDRRESDVGVFPMGMPLITGPAVLTTTLIMVDTYGAPVTFIALVLNMLVVWITLAKSDQIMNWLGANGIRAFSKIMFILLAAIAVMMVRRGISGAFLK